MGTILVVDDSPVIVRLLKLALKSDGHEVVSAADGDEGLSKIRELQPPLVLLDAMMPKRDGYEVCEQVRADPGLSQPYVIMLTAGAQDADRTRAERAGVNEFMTKPFSPSGLLERVQEILGKR